MRSTKKHAGHTAPSNNCSTAAWWRDTRAESRAGVQPGGGPAGAARQHAVAGRHVRGRGRPGAHRLLVHGARGCAAQAVLCRAMRAVHWRLCNACSSPACSAPRISPPTAWRAGVWEGMEAVACGAFNLQGYITVLCMVRELMHTRAGRQRAQDQRVVSGCRIRVYCNSCFKRLAVAKSEFLKKPRRSAGRCRRLGREERVPEAREEHPHGLGQRVPGGRRRRGPRARPAR